MIKQLLTVAFLSINMPLMANASATLPWSTTEGMQRLSESRHKIDFFKLANHFEPQINKAFCGPASATIVLNAIRSEGSKIVPPSDPTLLGANDKKYLPKREGWSLIYNRYSQNNIFLRDQKPRAIVLGKPISKSEGKPKTDFGFQIRQLAELLTAHKLNVTLKIVDAQSNTNNTKAMLVENLKTSDDYIIVNYHRPALKQKGGGHISPVGAYHQESDSFLLMDTAPNKAEWVWVEATKLIQAMATFDTVENRGFITVKESSH